MIQGLEDFFTKGFQIFNGQPYYDSLQSTVAETKFDYFTGDEYHASHNQDLLDMILLENHLLIAQDIVEKYFTKYSIGRRMIWESVNRRAMLWHNDLADHTNTFFLLYHNDTSEILGGAVCFRYNGIEEKIYPRAGDLIFFNSLNNFEHKAENSSQQRVVSSYYFDIDHGYVY